MLYNCLKLNINTDPNYLSYNTAREQYDINWLPIHNFNKLEYKKTQRSLVESCVQHQINNTIKSLFIHTIIILYNI